MTDIDLKVGRISGPCAIGNRAQVVVTGGQQGGKNTATVARLLDRLAEVKKQRDELLKVLKSIEWVPPCDDCQSSVGAFCPSCGSWEGQKHSSDCRLVRVVEQAEEE